LLSKIFYPEHPVYHACPVAPADGTGVQNKYESNRNNPGQNDLNPSSRQSSHESDGGYFLKPIGDPVKEAKGCLKDKRFSTQSYFSMKKEEKDLEK